MGGGGPPKGGNKNSPQAPRGAQGLTGQTGCFAPPISGAGPGKIVFYCFFFFGGGKKNNWGGHLNAREKKGGGRPISEKKNFSQPVFCGGVPAAPPPSGHVDRCKRKFRRGGSWVCLERAKGGVGGWGGGGGGERLLFFVLGPDWVWICRSGVLGNDFFQRIISWATFRGPGGPNSPQKGAMWERGGLGGGPLVFGFVPKTPGGGGGGGRTPSHIFVGGTGRGGGGTNKDWGDRGATRVIRAPLRGLVSRGGGFSRDVYNKAGK